MRRPTSQGYPAPRPPAYPARLPSVQQYGLPPPCRHSHPEPDGSPYRFFSKVTFATSGRSGDQHRGFDSEMSLIFGCQGLRRAETVTLTMQIEEVHRKLWVFLDFHAESLHSALKGVLGSWISDIRPPIPSRSVHSCYRFALAAPSGPREIWLQTR